MVALAWSDGCNWQRVMITRETMRPLVLLVCAAAAIAGCAQPDTGLDAATAGRADLLPPKTGDFTDFLFAVEERSDGIRVGFEHQGYLQVGVLSDAPILIGKLRKRGREGRELSHKELSDMVVEHPRMPAWLQTHETKLDPRVVVDTIIVEVAP
jgi:hypothetical protein